MNTRLVVSALAFGLAACSSSSPTSSMSASTGGSSADAFITVADYQFAPDSITISAGKTVEWSNNGPSSHTVTSDNASWSSVTLASPGTDPYGGPTGGGTFLHTFNSAGTYHFHCSIHSQMTGVVVVTP